MQLSFFRNFDFFVSYGSLKLEKMAKNAKKSQNFDFEPPEMSKKIKISKKAQISFSNML